MTRHIFSFVVFLFVVFVFSGAQGSRPLRPPFSPVEVTTEKLTVYGKTFSPVEVTTEKLTVYGKAFRPVEVTTEKLTVYGNPSGQGKSIMNNPAIRKP